jgi:hypothetical protein
MIIPNRKKKVSEPERIKINGHRYENLEMFKYLGSLVTNTNAVEAEKKEKIFAGNKFRHALGHLRKKSI